MFDIKFTESALASEVLSISSTLKFPTIRKVKFDLEGRIRK